MEDPNLQIHNTHIYTAITDNYCTCVIYIYSTKSFTKAV